ncbi:MAG: response regulator transcription factor [Ktedonobacteraceae bacterium]|nr:response regulator transcription factor [Ktedonobacteraceae bacterium]MBV8821924.1 response regulator transcription factor [Ktedonobacteraceae bacterium]MBV9019836.1 response regulator transcription factor [Ktedonobacteraceae bacterium]
MPEEPSMHPIRVLLADDHEILRQGLKLLLGLQPEIQVVGEARTGHEVVEQVARLCPDVVVMDISMPEMDGLQACSIIRRRQPETHVLMLTMHESEEYFLQALHAGAAGYLVKKVAPAELHAAVSTVAQGGVFLYPGLAKVLIRAYLNEATSSSLEPSSLQETTELETELSVLTPRELEILRLVAAGHTSKEIADHLVLSIKTVQAHRAKIMEKLDLHDITHLVRFAIHHRLIPPRL